MDPSSADRLKILRVLRQFHAEWPNSWLGVRDIAFFRRETEAFVAAAGELEAEGLILKIGGDNRSEPGYRLNPERIADLRREFVPSIRRIVLAIAFALLAGVMAFATFRAH
jgi:hypothetical protein